MIGYGRHTLDRSLRYVEFEILSLIKYYQGRQIGCYQTVESMPPMSEFAANRTEDEVLALPRSQQPRTQYRQKVCDTKPVRVAT